MNKHMLKAGVALFSILPTVLMAGPMTEGSSYGGVSFSQLTYDEDGVSDDPKLTALTGRFGYFVANQIAIEGRLGFGLSDDTVTVNDFGQTVDVDFEIDRLFGIYAVGHLPLSNTASLYAVLGFTDIKATFSAEGLSFSGTDSGFSYGAGAEFQASE